MKQNSRETMQRALGIIDGISFVGKKEIQDALVLARELLETILDDEEEKADG